MVAVPAMAAVSGTAQRDVDPNVESPVTWGQTWLKIIKYTHSAWVKCYFCVLIHSPCVFLFYSNAWLRQIRCNHVMATAARPHWALTRGQQGATSKPEKLKMKHQKGQRRLAASILNSLTWQNLKACLQSDVLIYSFPHPKHLYGGRFFLYFFS